VKLKELEIFGFKSFADRTLVKFGRGITIVVGPNGSGKSNIFDAIKWVLGTQSPKSLRGSKMEDVIFIGSDDRKTLGMAEVSLTFDNSDRTLNLRYEEVKITRRLYRSGESEYFINDNPVRLRDIIELFLDTGVGIDSYSVLSQGEVQRIIDAKPHERREIFEEAAGITKYIRKRDEALRKLEATEQNMLRINDILVEVKRQTSALERQAKKAEKYRELKQEWSDLVIRLFMKEIRDRKLEQDESTARLNDVERRIEEENTKLSTHEMKYEEMKLEAAKREHDINDKREKWVIRQQEIKRLEDNLKFLSQRHVELTQRVEDLRSENVENVGRMEALKAELELKEKALNEKFTVLNSMQGRLTEEETSSSEFAAQFEIKKKEREDKLHRLEQSASEHAAIRNKIVEYEMAVKNIEEQIQRNDEAGREAEEKLRVVEAEISRLSENKVIKETEISKIKELEASLINEKIDKTGARETIEAIIKELNLGISRMESRHNFLVQLHEKMEGYGEVVRKVLTEFKDSLGQDKRETVVDTAGNLMAVDKKYESAVEKTLSTALQAVLLADTSLVAPIFEKYGAEKGDITLLASPSDSKAIFERSRQAVKHELITGYLPDMMLTDEKHEPVKLLFHNIFLTPDIASAQRVITELDPGFEYFLLTEAGELVSSLGIYKKSGGQSEAGTGLLSREREINELSSEITMARGKCEAVEEEKSKHDTEIAEIEAKIEELSANYHSHFVEVVKEDERLKQKTEDRAAYTAAIQRVNEARTQKQTELAEIISYRDSYSGKLLVLDTENAALKAEAESLADAIRAMEEELNLKHKALEERRMEIMKEKSEHEFEEKNREALVQRIAETKAKYDSVAADIEDLSAKARAAEEERLTGEAGIENHRSSLVTDENDLNTAKADYENFRAVMKQHEDNLKEMGRERDHLRDSQYELKVRLNEINVGVKAIYDKMNEEFHMTPDDQSVMAAIIPDEEYASMRARADELRDKMDKLGVINLVAIEEYNELKGRQEFMQTQYNDLMSGRENLKKVIKKTNDESKQLFAAAFVEIKAKFAEVFKKMMNGGEADLVLVDQDNVLESGIDIIARPPGKKLQNITLLSGGEKSITAVSLLFALFLTKASPFCVMDEVDAALDDINIARFTNLVKSFNEMTQFIIITHNKITMEIADAIYGVSMESAGVSKIISVKLEGKGIDKAAGDKVRRELEGRGKIKKQKLDGFMSQEEQEILADEPKKGRKKSLAELNGEVAVQEGDAAAEETAINAEDAAEDAEVKDRSFEDIDAKLEAANKAIEETRARNIKETEGEDEGGEN